MNPVATPPYLPHQPGAGAQRDPYLPAAVMPYRAVHRPTPALRRARPSPRRRSMRRGSAPHQCGSLVGRPADDVRGSVNALCQTASTPPPSAPSPTPAPNPPTNQRRPARTRVGGFPYAPNPVEKGTPAMSANTNPSQPPIVPIGTHTSEYGRGGIFRRRRACSTTPQVRRSCLEGFRRHAHRPPGTVAVSQLPRGRRVEIARHQRPCRRGAQVIAAGVREEKVDHPSTGPWPGMECGRRRHRSRTTASLRRPGTALWRHQPRRRGTVQT